MSNDLELTGEPPAERITRCVTAADIAKAQQIMRRWHEAARRQGRGVEDVEHVMRVLSGLYVEAR